MTGPKIKGKGSMSVRRGFAPKGECKTCDDEKGMREAFPNRHSAYPSHDPSPNCESGKKPHCTCDVCF